MVQGPEAPQALLQANTLDSADTTPIGVGIDTSRYGHHATFLRPDLQPAAADLDFVESAQGYDQLRQRLGVIAAKHGQVHFHFRLDVAGRYADNLLAFLNTLPEPKTISCGDPQRNKNYRAAIFGQKKSDPVESAAAARYALTEKPRPMPIVTSEIRLLGQIASRLESQARQVTRLVNQLHNLLARAFPELALVVDDLAAGWVLKLLDRYPTAAKLASARPSSLEQIAYLPEQHIPRLLEYARTSVASLSGPLAEELVRDQVRQVKEAHVRQKSLEKMLVNGYRQLPEPNHLDTIIGFGEVTAAILTAKIVDPQRFAEPGKLVSYFGTFPVEASSGIDREGKARAPKRLVMCKRGNDLVRRYLYMAALSAAQHNPAVCPLYQRARAKHPNHPGIAVGHAMRKLLHLALAVWKTGKPFNPEHYSWDKAAHLDASTKPHQTRQHRGPETSTQAAGHNPETEPESSVVTAACGTASVAAPSVVGNFTPDEGEYRSAPAGGPSTSPAANAASPWIDFDHLKRQLPIQHLLEHLGLLADLRGRGSQRRGPCPVHDKNGQGQGRTFNVNLTKNVFQCFDPKCGIKGDVIDLWAAVKGLKLRDASVELVQTFNLEPAPGTEKRHG
jgi:transposase